MSWKVTTNPVSEPLTATEVKNYLKVDTSADDELIDILIEGARRWVERHCTVGLLPQTITETFDDWPKNSREWELTVSPLRSVTAIYYKDSNGDVQTWDAANYVVDAISKPPRVQIAYGVTWPTLRDEIDAVSAVYVVGYDDASAIPANVKRAMLLTIADAYDNRTDHIKRMPTAAEYLLQSTGERIWQFR